MDPLVDVLLGPETSEMEPPVPVCVGDEDNHESPTRPGKQPRYLHTYLPTYLGN